MAALGSYAAHQQVLQLENSSYDSKSESSVRSKNILLDERDLKPKTLSYLPVCKTIQITKFSLKNRNLLLDRYFVCTSELIIEIDRQ